MSRWPCVREGVDNSYVSRMVNLTTLAPDMVAAILDDALPNHIALFDPAVDPPALWDEQRPGSCRPSEGTRVKWYQVPTLLAHE